MSNPNESMNTLIRQAAGRPPEPGKGLPTPATSEPPTGDPPAAPPAPTMNDLLRRHATPQPDPDQPRQLSPSELFVTPVGPPRFRLNDGRRIGDLDDDPDDPVAARPPVDFGGGQRGSSAAVEPAPSFNDVLRESARLVASLNNPHRQ